MFIREKRCLVLFLFFSLIISSCKSIPECISKNSKMLTIKWGYTNSKLERDTTHSFMLTSDMKIYEVLNDEKNKLTSNKINTLDEEKYCSILKLTTNTMLKTQILNEPCNECKFIELNNPNLNFNLKLKWNSKYIHSGTKLASDLFDSLMAITIPVKK